MHGWLIKRKDPRQYPTILHFHGNACNISHMLYDALGMFQKARPSSDSRFRIPGAPGPGGGVDAAQTGARRPSRSSVPCRGGVRREYVDGGVGVGGCAHTQARAHTRARKRARRETESEREEREEEREGERERER